MKFQELPISRSTAHHDEDPLLTAVKTVDLTLFDHNPHTLNRFAKTIRAHFGLMNPYLLPSIGPCPPRLFADFLGDNCSAQMSHVVITRSKATSLEAPSAIISGHDHPSRL